MVGETHKPLGISVFTITVNSAKINNNYSCKMVREVRCMIKNRTLFIAFLVLAAFISGVIVGKMDWTDASQLEYVHMDFESDTSKEKCFLCGANEHSIAYSVWKPNNIGILNLNTFDVHYVEINRYDDKGELVTTPSGVLAIDGMTSGNGRVICDLNSDNGYASITITGVEYSIDAAVVESKLCQDCLDNMNVKIRYGGTPAEYVVVNYKDRTIHPLVTSTVGFGMGDYLIDCQFKENGEIRLLAAFLPCGY